VGAGAEAVGCRARPARPDRLVAAGRRRVDHRRKKGGDQTGPSPINRGIPSSKYHLAVDANGLPLAVTVGPGNDSERKQLLPLVDQLLAQHYQPAELWADRGYDSDDLDQQLRDRNIQPRISKRCRRGDPDWGSGRRRRDPNARHRWVVERTNAWLRRFKRLSIRGEPNSHVYTAYLTIALLIILSRAL
jgi:IS5 family transposase